MSAPRGLDPVVLVDVDGLRWLFGMDRRGRLWQDCGPGPPPSLSLEGRQLVGPLGWIRDLGARRLARETGRFFLEALDTDYPPLPLPKSASARKGKGLDPQEAAAEAALAQIVRADMARARASALEQEELRV